MSFYNTTNQKNFFITDPLERIYKALENLTTSVESLSGAVESLKEIPGGSTLFLNYPNPYTYHPIEQGMSIENYFELSSTPELTEDSFQQVLNILPQQYNEKVFLTDPVVDPFNSYVSNGYWTSHLFLSTTSSNCSVGVTLVSAQQVNGYLDFNVISDITLINVTKSDVPLEHVILSYVPTGVFNYTPSVFYFAIIDIYNSGNTSAVVNLYSNGSTASRIDTNLIRVPVTKTFSWLNGYWDTSSDSINPVNGQFYLSNNPGPNDPELNIVQMDSIDNYVLKINGTSFSEANLYEWFQLSQIAYSGTNPCLQINNANDGSQFWIGTCQVAYDPTYGYRGFNYVYKRTFGSDPSINRLIIYSILGGGGTLEVDDVQIDWAGDSNDDYFNIYTGDGTSNPDVLIYTVVFGNTQEVISLTYLNNYFKSFIDNVVYTGGIVSTVTEMQTNFTNNFAVLKASLPPLFSFFEFLDFGDVTQDETSGSGVDFDFYLTCGRTYFAGGSHFGDNGINNGGSGYKVGETITFYGSNLGGISPDNDCVLTVKTINKTSGEVLSVSIAGTPAYLQDQDNIDDGGDDQYDNGNYLYTDSYGLFTYGTGAVQNDIFGVGSETIVDYNDAIFVMFSTNATNNNEFYTEGDLGADGDGFVDANQNASFNIYLDSFNTSNGLMIPSQLYNFSLTTNLGFSGFTLRDKLSFQEPKPSKFTAPPAIVPKLALRESIKAKHVANKLQLSEKLSKLSLEKVPAVRQARLDKKKQIKINLKLDQSGKKNTSVSQFLKNKAKKSKK